MDAVGDQLGAEALVQQRCGDHTRVAMRERAHGVEHVDDVSHAQPDSPLGLLKSRVCVPHSY